MPAKIYYESNKEHHRQISRHYSHNNKEYVLENKKKTDITI